MGYLHGKVSAKMTNYTYAIGDIHGQLDLLEELMQKIGAHTTETVSGTATIVFLGDYVDRGPQSAHVVEYLRGLTDDNKLRHILLKGNHEDMMVNVDDYWIPNGGHATIASYQTLYPMVWADRMTKDAEWMNGLPARYQDEHRVYVHAALDHTRPFDEQKELVNLWSRYDKNEDHDFFGKHVVHGHTPQKKPLLLANRTNIDTGACFKGGVLTAAVFKDSQPGGPVAILQAGGN
jgi:serine/threonine protein phosphatase 1